MRLLYVCRALRGHYGGGFARTGEGHHHWQDMIVARVESYDEASRELGCKISSWPVRLLYRRQTINPPPTPLRARAPKITL